MDMDMESERESRYGLPRIALCEKECSSVINPVTSCLGTCLEVRRGVAHTQHTT
jgi:hypothetical protein